MLGRLHHLLLAMASLAVAPAVLSAQVLLSAAWTDGAQPFDTDEAVEVINADSVPVDLGGWHLQDDDGGDILLPSLVLAPGERAWIARDAAAFALTFGAPPAIESAGTDPSVPDAAGTWPAVANAGDVILVSDPGLVTRDVLCFGGATPPAAGWTGAPATPGFDPAYGFDLLLTRDRVEGDIACVPDTDSAADWDDLRLERPGATHLLPASFDAPARVRGAIGPDATLPLFSGALADATRTIDLAIYEMKSTAVMNELLDAIARGVAVTILFEWESVGGPDDQQRFIAAELAAAGADVRLLRADAGEVRRYPFHHAKYAVIDGETTWVATENLGPTGHPVDATFGNRGWALRVDDPRVAGYILSVLVEDRDLRHPDVARFDPALDGPPAAFLPDTSVPTGWHAPLRSIIEARDASRVTPAMSPDQTSLETFGVLGLLRSATTSLDAQQLSIPTHWGLSADPPDAHPSALVQEILAAARRGVAVRVLLDGSWYSVEPSDPRDNDDTCALLNQAAAAESLALECRVLDPAWLGLTTIHVKGFVVDRRIVHVGSTNGTSNSYRMNREAGLQVESPALAAYFSDELARDWVVAGVGAEVPAEVTGLEVARAGANLVLSWDPPPARSPAVDGYRIHSGPGAASEAGWTALGESPTTSRALPMPPDELAFLLVAAYAAGPGGTIEGPSGWGDGYLDR